jgi:phage-related protein (TIGR01555 family)
MVFNWKGFWGKLSARSDSFANQVTLVGKRGRDKRLGAEAVALQPRSEIELANMFDGDTLARKIVLKPIQAALRNWVDFSSLEMDVAEALAAYVDEKNIKAIFTEACVWEDVFGGCVLVVGANDGQPMDLPLAEDRIQSIDYLVALDRHRVRRVMNFDEHTTEFFDLQLRATDGISELSPNARIHASRVIEFPGPISTSHARMARDGWGVSRYELCFQRLADISLAFDSTSVLLQSFVQTIYKVKGLVKAILDGNESYLADRYAALDMLRSIMGGIALDAEEESFELATANVSGLPELLDRTMMLAAEAADMQVTVLFGRSAAGMNATGEGDLQQWYDRLAVDQETRFRPRLEQLYRLLFLAKDGPTAGVEPEDWSFEFRPLRKQDDKTAAETRLIMAQADAAYIDRGVKTPTEVRESRFSDSGYSIETRLKDEASTLLEELEARKAERALNPPPPPPPIAQPEEEVDNPEEEG